jgi:hypothetical protein
MKPTDFKKIIKDAVREAIQEELKDILLEAVRAPRMAPVGTGFGTVTEAITGTSTASQINQSRSLYTQMMSDFKPGMETISMNTSSPTPQGSYIPSGVSAGIEGTLHPGELGLDQIMGLINTK